MAAEKAFPRTDTADTPRPRHAHRKRGRKKFDARPIYTNLLGKARADEGEEPPRTREGKE